MPLPQYHPYPVSRLVLDQRIRLIDRGTHVEKGRLHLPLRCEDMPKCSIRMNLVLAKLDVAAAAG